MMRLCPYEPRQRHRSACCKTSLTLLIVKLQTWNDHVYMYARGHSNSSPRLLILNGNHALALPRPAHLFSEIISYLAERVGVRLHSEVKVWIIKELSRTTNKSQITP